MDPARLKAVLERHSSDEIAEFGHSFYVKLCDLNQWRLWAAGYVITGGMGDDSFHYFRSWIIGKGEQVFNVAMTNPDELGAYIDDQEVDNELLEYVPVEILASRGLPDPRDASQRTADDMPSGEAFDEKEVGKMMPRLWSQFGTSPAERSIAVAPPRLNVPPPVAGPRATPGPTQPQAPKNFLQRMWSGFVAFIAVVWKFAYPVFKLTKFGKLLLTSVTMFLSMWYYSTHFGWPFAVGFVICIFIHEMGHVCAALLMGMPASTPIFIPGMGALILARGAKSGLQSAIMGIGGPLFGTFAAFGCWGIYSATGQGMYLGLALMGFFINLFNMMPVFPLDGGWITGAISPYIWVFGLVAIVVMGLLGFVTNLFIWILIIMSLPGIVNAFKTGTLDREGVRTTGLQRALIGLAYVSLCGVLVWGISQTNEGAAEIRRARTAQPIQ